MGHSVDTASDAEAGTSLARTNEYDLVITDLGMPGKTGREVVSDVKRFRPTQPVAISSGWSADAVRNAFRGSTEPDFYISKPINAAKLRKVLEQIPANNQVSH